ncbi:MAG: hypothetical protein QOJ97_1354 [Solirubrobacteraceae bacterium]|nr:hypothetical protein [Solirubrobacteraceae bacterium]
MRKLIGAGMLTAALAAASPALAQPVAAVTDPTANGEEGVFSGQYDNGQGNVGYQEGYVGVYEDGVVACNGRPYVVADQRLQGYVWAGPGQRSSNATVETPGGEAGAGNNSETAGGAPTGSSPCPDGDPQGVGR